jgi:hypothetical protein
MSTVGVGSVRSLLDQPHHDGSEAYVLERPGKLGGDAVLRVRVPQAVDAVVLRYVENGEPRAAHAEADADGWWVAHFPVTNPNVPYRWLLWR